MHGFIENEEESCKYKWINSSVSVFLILYVNEIFLMENDIPYITENKSFVIIIVLYKGLEKCIPHLGDKRSIEIDLRAYLGYPSLCT